MRAAAYCTVVFIIHEYSDPKNVTPLTFTTVGREVDHIAIVQIQLAL